MLKPTTQSNPAAPSTRKRSAPGDARKEETFRVPAWARAPCICWIYRWQSYWASCSWRPSSRSRVPGSHCWNVVYTSGLASCLPGMGSRIKIRHIPGHVSHISPGHRAMNSDSTSIHYCEIRKLKKTFMLNSGIRTISQNWWLVSFKWKRKWPRLINFTPDS